jgi:hypothetical protein
MLDANAADPQQIITELQGQLDQRTAERDKYRAERDEALDQQTATAEVLQVINSSPGDLTPVFDVMLEKATRLCDAALGVLSTFTEGGHARHRSFCGPPAIAEFFRGRPLSRPGPGTTLDRLIGGETCIQIPDVFRDVPVAVACRSRADTRVKAADHDPDL